MRERSRPRCRSLSWKRLSGLDNLNDDQFKSEMSRRLQAKSRANLIGLEMVSAKSAQKLVSDVAELDMSTKSEIYRRNLPLGLPKSISSLEYGSHHLGPVVKSRDRTVRIFSCPVKKTGLLETRDGWLRRSYKIIKEGLPSRPTEFEPGRLAHVDPEYLRKSLGSPHSVRLS